MNLARYLVIIVVITIIAWGSIFFTVIDQDNKLNTILSRHTSTIQTVENNQHVNALAIKTYIACLITPGVLNPNDTVAQLKVAEQKCFDNAPEVK